MARVPYPFTPDEWSQTLAALKARVSDPGTLAALESVRLDNWRDRKWIAGLVRSKGVRR